MTTTETAKTRKTPKTEKTDTTSYMSLEDVLEEIGRRGRVTSAVVLTYEFDPELVRSLARNGLLVFDEEASDASGPFLCWTAAFPAALFYDARRARSLARTPGNFETHFVARSARAAHHSKAYAFATEDGAFELVLGSFNFTHSGLRTNREVLLRFTRPLRIGPNSPKEAAALALHREWRDFLKATYAEKTTSDALNDYLGALDARLRAEEGATSRDDIDGADVWDALEKEAHRTVRLIASGYDKRAGYGRKDNRNPRFKRYRRTGLEALADYARELDFPTHADTRRLALLRRGEAKRRAQALRRQRGLSDTAGGVDCFGRQKLECILFERGRPLRAVLHRSEHDFQGRGGGARPTDGTNRTHVRGACEGDRKGPNLRSGVARQGDRPCRRCGASSRLCG